MFITSTFLKKISLISFLLILQIRSYAQNQDEYFEILLSLREEIKQDFKEGNHGLLSLSEEQLALGNFGSIDYYPIDSTLRVKAKFVSEVGIEFIALKSNWPKKKLDFVKQGYLEFELEGKTHRLAVYQGVHILDQQLKNKKLDYTYNQLGARNKTYVRGYPLIPFRDQTNGKETHKKGRYLTIPQKLFPGDEILLDFNAAYNPDFAYGKSENFCVIPPRKNTLKLAIRAGEKKLKF